MRPQRSRQNDHQKFRRQRQSPDWHRIAILDPMDPTEPLRALPMKPLAAPYGPPQGRTF